MSAAAAGRMIRIGWIALVAALGMTAAWPDLDGANEGARTTKAYARAFQGTPVQAIVPASTYTPDLPAPAVRPSMADMPADQRDYAINEVVQNTPAEPRSIPEPSQQPQTSPHPEIPQVHEPAQAVNPDPATGPSAAPPQESPLISETPTRQPETYVVTAYYLNVRAEPDKTSSIRGLLQQGDLVNVVGQTANGWLELENGQFIHSAYAEPAKAESEPVKNAAREVSIASASATPPVYPEKAILNPDPLQEQSGPAPLSKKVKTSSGMTEDDIAMLLEGTALEGHGLEEAILEVEETYGINAFFTIAVMKLESGNGKSKLAREKNNLFGLNATGGSNSKAYKFETKSDSVYKFGKLIAKSYVAKGYSTIEKVGKKYCPANPKWASLVESIMKRDHRKLSKAVV